MYVERNRTPCKNKSYAYELNTTNQETDHRELRCPAGVWGRVAVGRVPCHATPHLRLTQHRVELRIRKLRNFSVYRIYAPRIAPSSVIASYRSRRARAGGAGGLRRGRPSPCGLLSPSSLVRYKAAPRCPLPVPYLPPSRLAPRPSATTCAYPEYTPQRYGSDTGRHVRTTTCTPTNTDTARKRHTTPGR
jgi:hypothetical protein